MLHFAQTLLAIHLVAMMIAAAGPVVAAVLEWRASGPAAPQAVRALAWHALVMLSMGILLGVIVGVVFYANETHDYQVALVALKRRIYWGIAEVLFSVVLMLAYAAMWGWCRHRRMSVRIGHRLLAVLASTNLLYHFPPLMIVLGKLATGGYAGTEPLDAAGFRELAWQREVLVATLHFTVASLVVAGAWATLVVSLRRQSTEALASVEARTASLIALAATAFQFPVGLWLMLSLPASRQRDLLGGHLSSTIGLIVSVLLAVSLLHFFAALAFSDQPKRSTPRLALLLSTLVVIAMVVTKGL